MKTQIDNMEKFAFLSLHTNYTIKPCRIVGTSHAQFYYLRPCMNVEPHSYMVVNSKTIDNLTKFWEQIFGTVFS